MTSPVATYLVFMQRAADGQTGESKDFIAPVRAASRAQALHAAERHYPAPQHRVLTCFTATDMQRVLTKVQAQWPDNIADTLESEVPPLPTQANTKETMDQRRDEIMNRLAQTRVHTARENANAMDRMLQDALTPKAAAQMARNMGEPLPQPVSHPLPRPRDAHAAPAQDLKSVLALLKKTGAATGTVQHTQDAPRAATPVTRQPGKPSEAPQAAITRRPASEAQMDSPVLSRQPKSVIEVFKGLRK